MAPAMHHLRVPLTPGHIRVALPPAINDLRHPETAMRLQPLANLLVAGRRRGVRQPRMRMRVQQSRIDIPPQFRHLHRVEVVGCRHRVEVHYRVEAATSPLRGKGGVPVGEFSLHNPGLGRGKAQHFGCATQLSSKVKNLAHSKESTLWL